MAEVVKMKIGQSCTLTGPVKGVADIVSPMASRIMEHPGHVWPSP